MTDTKGPESWLRGWRALQDNFVKTWQDQGAAGAADGPLREGFDLWARLAGSGGENEVLERSLAAARQFVSLMQGALGGAMAGKGATAQDWAQLMSGALGGIAAQHNPVADALRQAVGQGSRGFEQLFTEFAGHAAKPFQDGLQGFAQLPAFGYLRESQERQQKFVLAIDDYRQQFDRYNQLMVEASRKALDRLESKLAQHSEPGRQLKSFRELYDAWIDAAEEGYAEVALSDEFRRAYGALVNAQMRVRQMVQQDVERQTAAMGMPTRGELDAVHKKLIELRRRIAELEEGAAKGAVEAPHAAEKPAAVRPAPAPRPSASKPRSKPPRAVKSGAKVKAAASRARSSVRSAPKPIATVQRPAPADAGGSFAERLAATRKAARKGGR